MTLSVHTFLTLDGVMQAPGAPEEDRSGGFTAGGWQVPFTADGEFGEIVTGWFAGPHTMLLGRTTFEMFRGFWPQVGDADPVAARINAGPRSVVAHAGFEPAWEGTTVIDSADPIPEIARLRNESPGDIRVHGSAQLVAALHESQLIDEYHLIVFPVTVGGGKKLFRDGSPPLDYRVRESGTTGSGAVHLVLTPEPFRGGTYVVEDGRDVAKFD
jgi:dihydrofolate reductase